MHEGRMQTGWRTANAGSRLKLLITQEGTVWKASLPAVLRENPPYFEETSASFEARSAPRSSRPELTSAVRLFCAAKFLFDHLVGAQQDRLRHGQAECLGG